FSSLCKKFQHQPSAFFFKNSLHYYSFWMKSAAHRSISALVVACAVNNFGNLTPIERSDAHLTRLDRHIKRTVFQILSTKKIGRRRNRLHFGVSSHIVEHFGKFVTPSDDSVSGNYYSSDRDFTFFVRLVSLGERAFHEVFVGENRIHDPKIRYQLRTFVPCLKICWSISKTRTDCGNLMKLNCPDWLGKSAILSSMSCRQKKAISVRVSESSN